MPDQKTPPVPAAQVSSILERIEPLDTTKVGVRAYLDEAAKATKTPWHSGAAHKLAVFRFIADSCKLSGPTRQQAWKQFLATPGWFGANASAARQAFAAKVGREEVSIEA